MIETIITIWPPVRRFFIWFGAANAITAAIFWLSGVNPAFNSVMVFIGLVAFLLSAKAEDEPL